MKAYPFVYFRLGLRLNRGPCVIDDETELCVEPIGYLVGLLRVIGHGKSRKKQSKYVERQLCRH